MTDHVFPKLGVGILIRKEGKVLLGWKLGEHGDCWCPPGGKVDLGEDPLDAARREAEEETGLKLPELTFATYTNDLHPDGVHYITLHFIADCPVDQEPEVHEPHKMRDWRWWDWEEVEEPMFFNTRILKQQGFDPFAV